jgi:hypothetical protein
MAGGGMAAFSHYLLRSPEPPLLDYFVSAKSQSALSGSGNRLWGKTWPIWPGAFGDCFGAKCLLSRCLLYACILDGS